jgi:hypothetical protein
MTGVIQNTFLAGRLKRLSDLRDELAANSFATPEERAILRQKIAALDAAIKQERAWSPSDRLIAELEELERDAEAYGQASFAANLHQVRDLVSNPAKGEYHPSNNEDLRSRSAQAAEKLAKLAEKHRIPLDGLDSLKRWGLLDSNGRYQGGIGSK